MEDDSFVTSCPTLVNVIIAEVKTGPCALNRPWTSSEAGNIKRVLKAIGCVSEDVIDQACAFLYDKGYWSDSTVTIRLFALGKKKNLKLSIPKEQQLTWGKVISFCIQRFRTYERQKAAVSQWAPDGRKLREFALLQGSQQNRNTAVREYFKLHRQPSRLSKKVLHDR